MNISLKKLGISLAVIIATISLVVLGVYSFTFFRTDITPSPEGMSQYSSYVDISFNKEVEGVAFVKISPQSSLLASYEINKSTIRLNLDSLLGYDMVSVEIETITSSDGYVIDYLAFDISLSDDMVSGEQLDEVLEEQDKTTQLHADPILAVIPHSTLDYTMKPNLTRVDAEGKALVDVEVKLLLSAADVKSGRDATVARYKKEALDYLVSKNIPLDEYTITFTVVESF